MAFSPVSGTKKRYPQGNRWRVELVVDDVTTAGDYIAAGDIGLKSIDAVVATAKGGAAAVQAVANSQDGSAETSFGDVYLKSGSGTIDVHLQVTGK